MITLIFYTHSIE
ncbi:hypothetical protein SAMN04488056_1344 [Cohaesibacter marisflavi]|uniref:Uncharacterized protein n=1 Tax=Cohaesibacter marisflavi TaxID=655353 RepID=A0A1I5NK64_9HYPH|nr:hypothetical protein SAMN04488056_1344 [Cohaesibacter marisflavi]